ncbi:DUF11 domain-containing protein [Cellulosimicrobium marinum]|uniref:DUF11 domain-containing protein n=1 Tax=Cellulosimicrobium marinum TaxID=1638992 RepID=UPI001E612AF6|nr:DUF11 domain-containing protein [Cellulosimicrobium marinum]MCB7135594.1 DUF11 domain-containing protein [Cellulosimicrobium marinum]
MHTLTMRRAAAAAVALVLGTVGIAAAQPASAAPVTSTGSLGTSDITVTYSETDLAPGDTVDATISFRNVDGMPKDVDYRIGGGGPSLADVFDLTACTFAPGVAVTCGFGGFNGALVVTVDDLPSKVTTVDVELTVRDDAAPGTVAVPQSYADQSTLTILSPPVAFEILAADADLGVSLDAVAGPLLSSQITYTLDVTNSGPADATASVVTVAVPSQASSATGLPPGCTYSSGNDTITCDTAAVANGTTATRSFTVNVGLLSLGSLPATATRTSSSPTDPNAANDTASANCTTLTSLLISCP